MWSITARSRFVDTSAVCDATVLNSGADCSNNCPCADGTTCIGGACSKRLPHALMFNVSHSGSWTGCYGIGCRCCCQDACQRTVQLTFRMLHLQPAQQRQFQLVVTAAMAASVLWALSAATANAVSLLRCHLPHIYLVFSCRRRRCY